MSGNLNRVMLIGRLTQNPEMRYTSAGQPVTTFGLATNRYGTSNEGEPREFVEYHQVVAWNAGTRNLAEIVGQFTHKGSLVYVEGRLQTRSWDGQDGQKKKTTEVVANDVQFLDRPANYAASSDPLVADSIPATIPSATPTDSAEDWGVPCDHGNQPSSRA